MSGKSVDLGGRRISKKKKKHNHSRVTDSLTGLWNRRYLSNEIEKDLALMHRAQLQNRRKGLDERDGLDSKLLFLMMDLDGLKGVNDTTGIRRATVRSCR